MPNFDRDARGLKTDASDTQRVSDAIILLAGDHAMSSRAPPLFAAVELMVMGLNWITI